MDHNCPICQRTLEKDSYRERVDYHCSPPRDDHHYAKRVLLTDESQLIKLKVRISPESSKLYLKIHYDQGYSEVWTNPDDDESKIRINHIIEPDLTDLKALQTKLRTYLVFS